MQLPLQTFVGLYGSSRFTFYETWFNETIAIVEEKLWEGTWTIEHSFSLPKNLFHLLRTECVAGSSTDCLKSMDTRDEPFSTTIIYDRFELPAAVRQLLFKIDCRNVPLTENQLGCMSDFEALESYWDIKATPASPDEDGPCPSCKSPRSKLDASFCETPIKGQPHAEMCPPAPKKLRCVKQKATLELRELDLPDY